MPAHLRDLLAADDGLVGVVTVAVAGAAAALLVGTLLAAQLLTAADDQVRVDTATAVDEAIGLLDAAVATLDVDPYAPLTGTLDAAVEVRRAAGGWEATATVDGPGGPVQVTRRLAWRSYAATTATALASGLDTGQLWPAGAQVAGARLHAAGPITFSDDVQLTGGWVAADPLDGQPPYILGDAAPPTVAVYRPDPPADQPAADVRTVADRPDVDAVSGATARLIRLICGGGGQAGCVDVVAGGEPATVRPTADGLLVSAGGSVAGTVGWTDDTLVVTDGPLTIDCPDACAFDRPVTFVAGGPVTVSSDIAGGPVGILTADVVTVTGTSGRTVDGAVVAAGGLEGRCDTDGCGTLTIRGSVTTPDGRLGGSGWSLKMVPDETLIDSGPAWLPGRAAPWVPLGDVVTTS